MLSQLLGIRGASLSSPALCHHGKLCHITRDAIRWQVGSGEEDKEGRQEGRAKEGRQEAKEGRQEGGEEGREEAKEGREEGRAEAGGEGKARSEPQQLLEDERRQEGSRPSRSLWR